jgi:hypothetical protein
MLTETGEKTPMYKPIVTLVLITKGLYTYTQLLTTSNTALSLIYPLYSSQFTVTRTLVFSVFISRILATDFNTVFILISNSTYKVFFHSLIPFLPFLINPLRLPSQEIPSILIQPDLDPRYIALGWIQQKTPFHNNSSSVIHVCWPRPCIETTFLLLLRAFPFPKEPVYRAVA